LTDSEACSAADLRRPGSHRDPAARHAWDVSDSRSLRWPASAATACQTASHSSLRKHTTLTSSLHQSARCALMLTSLSISASLATSVSPWPRAP